MVLTKCVVYRLPELAAKHNLAAGILQAEGLSKGAAANHGEDVDGARSGVKVGDKRL